MCLSVPRGIKLRSNLPDKLSALVRQSLVSLKADGFYNLDSNVQHLI
jgi:hypothetical protein